MITLCPTRIEDLDLFVAAESEPDARPWLGEVSRAWHEGAMADPDVEHLTVADGITAGYALVAGLRGVHGSIELRRIVVLGSHRGRGIGRSALHALATRAFDVHGAHRVWLDVKTDNARARHLYRSAGFTEEGVLRDASREPDGSYSSLAVLSVLAGEPLR